MDEKWIQENIIDKHFSSQVILFSILVDPHKTINSKQILRLLECKSTQMCTNVNNSCLLEMFDKLNCTFSIPIQQLISDSQKFVTKQQQQQQQVEDLDLKKCRQVLEQGFQIEDQHFVIVQNFLHSFDCSFLIAISKRKESVILVKKWKENGFLLFLLERKAIMQHHQHSCSFQHMIQQSVRELLQCARILS